MNSQCAHVRIEPAATLPLPCFEVKKPFFIRRIRVSAAVRRCQERTVTITQDNMDHLSRSVFIPVMLVLDSWMFQYLMTIYYPRRREWSVRSLLLASFLGFATQVYSHESREMALELNDISETSLQLTFLIQITLIGRAVCKKVKVRTIAWFTYTAEALVILNWIAVLGSILALIEVISGVVLHIVGNVLESISLLFTFIFRFYYLSTTNGFQAVVAQRKLEFFLYVLFMIHEYPFMVLEHYNGVKWEFAQGRQPRDPRDLPRTEHSPKGIFQYKHQELDSQKQTILLVFRTKPLTSQSSIAQPIQTRIGSYKTSLRSVRSSPDIAKFAVTTANQSISKLTS